MVTTKKDLSEYWRERSDGRADLSMVGHRSLGAAFNSYIYRRRLDVLNECVAELGLTPSTLRVLDLGCGNGFYAEFWRALGVTQYVGVDVSQQTIASLEARFPEYRFLAADLGQRDALQQLYGQFDVVTLFDVIYHITDDTQALQALTAAAHCLGSAGHVILFDQVARRDSSLTGHVKLRGLATFGRLIEGAGLTVERKKKLFVLLAPPVFGMAPVDFVIAALYKLLGFFMKRMDKFGGWAGRKIYELDQRLIQAGVGIPNHEAYVLVRRAAAKTG